MDQIILIAHNVRSCHNVGSLFRLADGVGLTKLYLSGYSPYPLRAHDQRLPHISTSVERRIAKTALGAEKTVAWSYQEDIFSIINRLRVKGFKIVALEQSSNSTPLKDFKAPEKLVVIVGNEVSGLEVDVLKAVDQILEIPMLGTKESFNVVQAASMILYHVRFLPT